MTDPVTSLYIHVPFCARKCDYCAFYSEPAPEPLISQYLDALEREFDFVAPGPAPTTVFFGGGTPSLLGIKHWRRIFEWFEKRHWNHVGEWTIESNPATVTREKALFWREHGVNRVSMGIQSLNAELLDRLGRLHSREKAFQAFDILRSAGFANINVDLMFAIPGQTMAVWRETLAEATALGSEHLSCYEVIYEEDTPLFAQLKAGKFDVNEDLACDMYDALLDAAGQAGFQQYEVANFARHEQGDSKEFPSRACRHNVNYWRGGSFYGLGPSATGYVRGVRTRNWANTGIYCRLLEQRKPAIESREELPPLARAGEMAAFGLRMNSGWPYALFQQKTGYDLPVEWGSEIAMVEEKGFGWRESDRFRLTRAGLRFADWVAEQFLRS
jgi:oxygen-independent coproporphyrinogen-3 oxidase